MCGIAVAIDASRDRAAARVRLIDDTQQHWGPDHGVLARVGGFALGNTRLVIRDSRPTGNQPLVSADDRYHGVFKGEMDNYGELVKRYGLAVQRRDIGRQ